MATLTNEKILEAIKEKSVLELNELVKMIQDEFGVTPMAMAAPAAAPAAEEAAEEKTTFDLVLTGFGEKKIQVIKAVREVKPLGLKEAKDLVEGAPQAVLENVTKARQQAIDVRGVADRAQAENFLTQALRQLFALAEDYPELKATQNFLALQEELTSTENKVAYARQFYNDTVMTYNVRTQQVPANIIANTFNFRREEFFELEEPVEREAPVVEF